MKNRMTKHTVRGYHRGVKRIGDVAVIIIYIIIFALSLKTIGSVGNVLVVETENGRYAYSLSENGIYSFTGPLGVTEIEIRDGKARVISSPCRNKTCMKAGWAGTLCCLPNRIVATATGEGGGVDAISG